MTDFERTAYRNEIDFLQHEVERYKEQNNGTRQYHRKGM